MSIDLYLSWAAPGETSPATIIKEANSFFITQHKDNTTTAMVTFATTWGEIPAAFITLRRRLSKGLASGQANDPV
jgi:hypothetical protein